MILSNPENFAGLKPVFLIRIDPFPNLLVNFAYF